MILSIIDFCVERFLQATADKLIKDLTNKCGEERRALLKAGKTLKTKHNNYNPYTLLYSVCNNVDLCMVHISCMKRVCSTPEIGIKHAYLMHKTCKFHVWNMHVSCMKHSHSMHEICALFHACNMHAPYLKTS